MNEISINIHHHDQIHTCNVETTLTIQDMIDHLMKKYQLNTRPTLNIDDTATANVETVADIGDSKVTIHLGEYDDILFLNDCKNTECGADFTDDDTIGILLNAFITMYEEFGTYISNVKTTHVSEDQIVYFDASTVQIEKGERYQLKKLAGNLISTVKWLSNRDNDQIFKLIIEQVNFKSVQNGYIPFLKNAVIHLYDVKPKGGVKIDRKTRASYMTNIATNACTMNECIWVSEVSGKGECYLAIADIFGLKSANNGTFEVIKPVTDQYFVKTKRTRKKVQEEEEDRDTLLKYAAKTVENTEKQIEKLSRQQDPLAEQQECEQEFIAIMQPEDNIPFDSNDIDDYMEFDMEEPEPQVEPEPQPEVPSWLTIVRGSQERVSNFEKRQRDLEKRQLELDRQRQELEKEQQSLHVEKRKLVEACDKEIEKLQEIKRRCV